MCEYCGCQSLTAIDDLTREHDAVVDLISHVRDAHRAGDTGLMARLARRIGAVLEPHTQVEEHGLFPALADEFPEQMAALEGNTASSRPCWRRPRPAHRGTSPGRTG
jgi:hypothetical protein